ncbi:hypothetical protein ACIQPP_45760 [Streptomyces violaceusniger]|uniref:hypothetical protein n=1 Tax=Streptomyces violaceusniger TaxID=68280 RepID=UPI001F23539A|nr:hypothetical protein [Streptomyces hygroscopicus]
MAGLGLAEYLGVVGEEVGQLHHAQVIGGRERVQPLLDFCFKLDFVPLTHTKNNIPVL